MGRSRTRVGRVNRLSLPPRGPGAMTLHQIGGRFCGPFCHALSACAGVASMGARKFKRVSVSRVMSTIESM